MHSFLRYILGLFAVIFSTVCVGVAQPSHPVYVSVQVVPPAGVYLTDYYSGTRDRLVVTLINRDNEQPVANVKLRVVIRNSSVFELRSREELYYPMLTLESGVPLRLTSMDLQPYLAPDRVTMTGYLDNGRLPNGMTEFRVQVLDYTTGRVLSEFGVGRVWLESKQPPQLTQPSRNDLLSLGNPQHIRFSWMPRHQGLAQTSYEFVLKELPDNGVPPQTSFMYGPEIYRTDIRQTTLDYGTMEPPLEPGKRYGWQVRAKVLDGVDEVGVFDNQGYSEISWFELSDNCPEVKNIQVTAGFRKIDLAWHQHPDQNAFVVQWRPKTQRGMYEWESSTVFENAFTIERLQEGWTYECRVGALCIRDTPIFGQTKEVTLPEKNEERLRNCGKIPVVDLANQEPNEDLQVGDMVTIGGDFPMRIDEITSLGNGWYSGKGGLVFPWIFDIGINLEFDRLRVNTDNVQIDGEVETAYDDDESLIGNTNQLDAGGRKLEQGGVKFPSLELNFTVPDLAQCEYNEETGELVITDENGGDPQTVKIPKNDGQSSFPMVIVDAEGNRYQVDVEDSEGDRYQIDAENTQTIENSGDNKKGAIEIDVKFEISAIKSYDVDSTNKTHIEVANVVNKYLVEYVKLNGESSIPPNFKIIDAVGQTAGSYVSFTKTIEFSTNILAVGANQQKYIVYHELAHYEHSINYPNSYNNMQPILVKYYEFIDKISTYPKSEKDNKYNEYQGRGMSISDSKSLAEVTYNREVYAVIVAMDKMNPRFLSIPLTKEIQILETKSKNNTITLQERETLGQLTIMQDEFSIILTNIMELLTQ